MVGEHGATVESDEAFQSLNLVADINTFMDRWAFSVLYHKSSSELQAALEQGKTLVGNLQLVSGETNAMLKKENLRDSLNNTIVAIENAIPDAEKRDQKDSAQQLKKDISDLHTLVENDLLSRPQAEDELRRLKDAITALPSGKIPLLTDLGRIMELLEPESEKTPNAVK